MPGATKTADVSNSSGRGEWVAKIGTVISAIMATSCCWLPPLLIVMGVSGAGMAQKLQQFRYPMMVVTFGFIGAAFYFTYRPRRRSAAGEAEEECCANTADTTSAGVTAAAPAAKSIWPRWNMMTMNKAMLWVVTAMAVAFLFFPQHFMGMLAGDNQVTADMTQAVLTVEGMTCEG